MVLLSSFIFIPRIFLGGCHIQINSWKVTWKIHFYKLNLVFPWPSLCYRSSSSGSIFLSRIIFKNSAKHTISHAGVCVRDGSRNKPQDTTAWMWYASPKTAGTKSRTEGSLPHTDVWSCTSGSQKPETNMVVRLVPSVGSEEELTPCLSPRSRMVCGVSSAFLDL